LPLIGMIGMPIIVMAGCRWCRRSAAPSASAPAPAADEAGVSVYVESALRWLMLAIEVGILLFREALLQLSRDQVAD
jgi:hypothetical protein